ncbi:AAA family ATPase [Persephonella atlantica]|uniref:AAA family ATPase n=1 Tax=Persephonella atlantica TaxID=2699429 RepID=A0ABS1GJK1_9AQUI|nr:AAA family ATPase [Persephonella atlantica]MBK3333114.1 AAA family ATPase [Persephonella atlantica]
MKSQNKITKHISVRLTWHDNGWNGNSCKNPAKNLPCMQDANQFLHRAKVIFNSSCSTDTGNAKKYLSKYLKQNSCFLNYSKLGYICKIHSIYLLEKSSISQLPPCDSFSAFKEKNPYVHTKNPARITDRYDEEAIKNCSNGKKPWEYIKNWNQVKYFPQDYRKHIVNRSSVALFYTVNFPEESGKFIVGYSVIKDKNEDFISAGKGKTTTFNKSNAGGRWGEEWCFLLDEKDRYRFPFQELIDSGNTELLERARNILKVEPQDEKFFRNLSLFIPEHILIKYLKKLRQAVNILEFSKVDPKTGGDFTKIDTKIQELRQTYLSFKYPGLPAVGRFLFLWDAYRLYEEHLDFESELKESLFEAVEKNSYFFTINGKKLFIGSKKKGLHPKNEISQDFLKLLKDTLIYYPVSSDKIIKRIELLINKSILNVREINKNPYLLYEEFIPSLDDSIGLSFEDVDYGEYKKSIEKFQKSSKSKEIKDRISRNFYLNPYRIRALIHEFFKVYEDDPGFVWVSFKDMERYIRKRLSSGLGTGKLEFDFEEILKADEIKETVEVDFDKKYLTLKKLAEYEKEVNKKIKHLLTSKSLKHYSNVKNKIKDILGEIPEEEIIEKEKAVKKILSNRFTFISGVAGSGKSTLIKILTEILKEHKEDYKILTPTGKSGERLRQEGLESETIHYFLKSNGFIDDELLIFNKNGNVQEVKNLIIDEISMVPLDLLYYLFNGVNLKKLKRLILVGDIKQLPPIGYGYPAKDIYNFLVKHHPQNLIKLDKSYRSTDKFIKLANKLRNKNLTPEDITPYLTDSINNNSFQILRFSNQQDLENLLKQILEKENITKEKLAKDPEVFQILTPKKEGYSGSNHINRYISNLLDKGQFDWNNTKVIKLVNTYCPEKKQKCVETFNGMIGSIFYKNGWKIRFKGGQIIDFSGEKLGYEYDYAYGITIHKSQGSEFGVVVVILPKNIGNLFTRELLYTALTRAKKRLYLLVEDENLFYETPLDIERSSKLFEGNFLEIPENTEYISLRNTKILSKLDLYISAVLELNNISYTYKSSEADFETSDRKIYLINLNTYQGKIKNRTITESKESLKLTYTECIDVKSFTDKLKIRYPDRSGKNREDYREKLRSDYMKKKLIHIEPDTNLKIKTHNGLKTRSISEAILMLIFDHLGLRYEYEVEVVLGGKKLLPDFYFSDKNIYWEHLGLLDDPYYMEKWQKKKEIYKNAKIQVLSIKDWNGEQNCCIYTTEKDIKNLNKLWREINGKRNFFTAS